MSNKERQVPAWAGDRGRFRSPADSRGEQAAKRTAARKRPASGQAARATATTTRARRPPAAAPDGGRSVARWRGAAGRAGDVAAQWAPTAGRILLGLVLAWFGYHELLLPGEWTGYVPVISQTSSLAIVAVLVHGWVLLVLAVALLAGIAPRICAALASVLLLEIVISLSVIGLSDTSMRDVGVLGLAVCLTGARNHRLVLRS